MEESSKKILTISTSIENMTNLSRMEKKDSCSRSQLLGNKCMVVVVVVFFMYDFVNNDLYIMVVAHIF